MARTMLAVGVPAGVEAMAHVTRQWRDDNSDNNAKVLINYDEGIALNEVDRHTFLVRMREVALGCASGSNSFIRRMLPPSRSIVGASFLPQPEAIKVVR